VKRPATHHPPAPHTIIPQLYYLCLDSTRACRGKAFIQGGRVPKTSNTISSLLRAVRHVYHLRVERIVGKQNQKRCSRQRKNSVSTLHPYLIELVGRRLTQRPGRLICALGTKRKGDSEGGPHEDFRIVEAQLQRLNFS